MLQDVCCTSQPDYTSIYENEFSPSSGLTCVGEASQLSSAYRTSAMSPAGITVTKLPAPSMFLMPFESILLFHFLV